jgi:protein-S-isoprenylcysteine O-methyltransferase Ste14
MRKAKLNITPDVVPGTQVITDGPYRVIRHPMYLAIFLALLPLVIEYFSFSRLIVYLALIINQVFKIEYEEKKLTKEFDYYRDYKMSSWKLLPYIY